MEDTNQGGNKKIYIAIILLLLLINGVAFYLLWNENKNKNDVTTEKVRLETQFKDKTVELDSLSAVLDQYKGQSVEKDSMISQQQAELENQKNEIKRLLGNKNLSKKQLEQANKMIEEYKASIAEMQKKIEELTKKNEELTTQNTQLNADLTSEKNTTSQLTEQNKGLSKKVELGSLLQLRNITVEGIKKKGNGKEVTTSKAKTAESMKISFETGDNKVLEAGNLSLYVRIINPKGETISVADQGSGILKMAESGQSMQYTKKADIDWNQSNKKIMVYWSQNIKDAGTYKIEIYQSGYLVGNGQITMK